jgi:hypothetical protein
LHLVGSRAGIVFIAKPHLVLDQIPEHVTGSAIRQSIFTPIFQAKLLPQRTQSTAEASFESSEVPPELPRRYIIIL